MRRIGLILGIAGGLIALTVVAAWWLIDPNAYRGLIQSQLEHRLNRKVTLGRMTLGLLPLRLQVADPVISENPQFGEQVPFVRAQNLDVRVSLSSLLRGNVTVNALELQRPRVELLLNKQGVWNFSTLGPSTSEASSSPSDSAGNTSLVVDKFAIRDGQIAITNQQQGTHFLYDHIDLTTQIGYRSGNVNSAGTLRFAQAQFNGLDLGYPITVDYNLIADLAGGVFTVSNAKVQLGSTPLTLSGSIHTNTTPSTLDLSVKSGDISVAEIARLGSAFGIAFSPGTSVAGRVRADVQAKGPASSPSLSGTIAAQNLQISGKDVPQPIEVKTLNVRLSPSEIRSDEFQATLGKTNAQASFAVRQYTSRTPAINVGLRAPAATLPELQSFAKGFGITGLQQINGGGALNLDLQAAGPLHSLSSTDLVRALNGNLKLDFNTLRVSGFDAARELANIGGFLQADSGNQSYTEILRLTGQLVVKNGLARTDDLQAQLGIGTVTATGTADLATEALDLKLLATLPKASSDKVGGTRVGGYMKTVLSNSEGELLLPVIVTGTFTQPKFSPDIQTFVQMQKKRLIPTLTNPEALSNVIGAIGKQKDKTDDDPSSGQKPADTIKGILGGFLGGRKSNDTK